MRIEEYEFFNPHFRMNPLMTNPRTIAIAGVSSNSGKTTLMCELLRGLSRDRAWEAIKLTRGHYRSCGKDPHACCVSHLLGEQPTVRSGRDATYTSGKDTGRYWDAGAVNVHWVIATDSQVETGIKQAVAQVKTPNVLIEGTSLLQVIPVDFAILVAGGNATKLKPSVRQALIGQKINAIYFSEENCDADYLEKIVETLSRVSPEVDETWLTNLPIFTPRELTQLIKICSMQDCGTAAALSVPQSDR